MEFLSIALVVVFIAMSLYLAKPSRRYDGKMVISTNSDGNKIFTLELDGDPAELVDKKSIRFKVDSSEKE